MSKPIGIGKYSATRLSDVGVETPSVLFDTLTDTVRFIRTKAADGDTSWVMAEVMDVERRAHRWFIRLILWLESKTTVFIKQ